MKNSLSVGRKILGVLGAVSCGFIVMCLVLMYIEYIEPPILVMAVFQFVLFIIYLSCSISIFSKRYNNFLNKEMIKHKFMTVLEIILLSVGNIGTFFASYIIWDDVNYKTKNIMLTVLIVTTLLILSNCIFMVISRVRFIENSKKKANNNLKGNSGETQDDNIVCLKKELYTTFIAYEESEK